jgi:hypothetical protein
VIAIAFCSLMVGLFQVMAAPSGVSASGLEYRIAVTPMRARVDQAIVVRLSGRARAAAAGPSFQDKSLTIELRRVGEVGEPHSTFPNRTTIERDGTTSRGGESVTWRLEAGEHRVRTFALDVLYDRELLRPGDYLIGMTLREGVREIRPPAVRLHLSAAKRP